VPPNAVVGHSSGEIAAAYAAGAISAFETITIAFYRGKVAGLQFKSRAMAAVGMGSEDIQKYLEPGVVAACENSERSITLAGDADVVERVVSRIKEAQPSILARFLQVDEAYHSHHIVAGKDEVSAKKLFFSTVTCRQLNSDCEVGAEYWQRKLGSPVLFYSLFRR
jgi:acyl transferase domain-containing protein